MKSECSSTKVVKTYMLILAIVFTLISVVLFYVGIPQSIPIIFVTIWVAAYITAWFILTALAKSVCHNAGKNVIHIRYGVFTHVEYDVQINKIIYISAVSGPIEKMYGLKILVFYSYGSKVILPWVDEKSVKYYREMWSEKQR